MSKQMDEDNAQAFTPMQGTVFWMAPEVVKAGQNGYTSKIDIWGVGCVVLEMWTGRRPWNDEEVYGVMLKVRGVIT
jgi:serine/threonine protein kinase